MKELFEIIVLPTNGGETWSTRLDKRYKLNLIEMKSLECMCEVTRMGRWRNEEVKCKVGVRGNMSDRVGQKLLQSLNMCMSLRWKVEGIEAVMARGVWSESKMHALQGHWS